MENKEIIENKENEEIVPFVIPNIYKYSSRTNEFIGSEVAEKDPAESIKQRKFIPLVPAYSTLLKPPEVEENKIQVYSKEIIEHKEITPETGEETITY